MPILIKADYAQEGMLAYTNAFSAYRDTRIKTASQGQLIVMLYDAIVKQLDKALDLMNANESGKKDPGRIEHIGKAVLKAQEIITELEVSLDFDQGGDIAKNLFALYTWFNKELMEANIKQDVRRITVVRNMAAELKAAWTQAAAADTAQERMAAGGPVGLNISG